MRFAAVVLMALAAGCGRSEMPFDGMPAALSSTVDAGPADAGQRDAGEPDAGVDAGMWCAPSGERCLADGWRYGVPGRCCNSRQTCRINGRYMFCEY